jgi:ribosomal protein S18 acetylase RimI-like enzyme
VTRSLFVAGRARGRMVGEALMREAARAVLARGGTRIDFTTDPDNVGAQRFYKRLGATEAPEVFDRYEGVALATRAGRTREVRHAGSFG